MEKISALLAICAGNSSVPGKYPTQRPVTRSCDVFFDLRLNKWVNNRETGDLRRYRAHYDVSVMFGSYHQAQHIKSANVNNNQFGNRNVTNNINGDEGFASYGQWIYQFFSVPFPHIEPSHSDAKARIFREK